MLLAFLFTTPTATVVLWLTVAVCAVTAATLGWLIAKDIARGDWP